MDAQIWYLIFSTLTGVINGAAFSHLGQISNLEMLHSKFKSMPTAFSHLMPSENEGAKQINDLVSLVWNEFINSMRQEDIITNRERDLLCIPHCEDVSVVRWPPFLLLNKISIAIDMAKTFKGKEECELFEKIKSDDYMFSAVIECYKTLGDVICDILEDEAHKMFMRQICKKVDESVERKCLLANFRMSELPSLSERLKEFLEILLNDEEEVETSQHRITKVLWDITDIITHDMMTNGHEHLETIYHIQNRDVLYVKKDLSWGRISIKPIMDNSWMEKIRRLHLLLTVKESSTDVPQNLEARRRITFFANSLFMNMPRAPKVRDMLSFSVLTPYYREDVLYTEEELNMENEDGISVLFHLQKLYPDEWRNFVDRMSDPKLGYSKEDMSEGIRQWVSYRGQTLYRTGPVRGMMYYRQALELQCFLDFLDFAGDDSANSGGYSKFSENDREDFNYHAQVLLDLKFTYVVSCQVYGHMKKSKIDRDHSCFSSIQKLMRTYPSLRIAYIDTTLELVNGRNQEVYYSVLVKGRDSLDEEIYRIKLPGNPSEIGEGKSENLNHAIVFTRGEALQTIDMNQENYFEEAYKMRNVLEEFLKPRRGRQKPTILGLREHIYTASVSSLSRFMSNQETSFRAIGQRTLADPLRQVLQVRFHYGHSDIFDKIFHTTRGGISKASRTININEQIFAGFNSTLRGGLTTQHEYAQVGKGRDASFDQISLFEAKLASGNAEQTLSRDVYRLGRHFDFYRMLSFYFSTVGYYMSSMVAVLSVYVILYGRLYMVMSGVERQILKNPVVHQNKALEETLVAQSVIQMGLFFMVPMAMEIALEKSFQRALFDFIVMHLQLASVFFTFQLGTRVHYYGRTLLHGGFKYRAIGRGFVPFRARFAEHYRLYSRSHFVKALELFILLLVCEIYGNSYRGSNRLFFLISSFSMWFLVACWLFAPFVFNPSGLDWHKVMDDWADWESWMETASHIGMLPEKSWESWWDGEQEHLKFTSTRGKVLEILLASRFFFYQYGIVYHLDIAYHSKSLMVYGLSWAFAITAILSLKTVSVFQRMFGFLETILFLGFLLAMTVLFVVYGLTISDLFAAILAFLPTGWAILLIGQACRLLTKRFGLWESITKLAKAYDYIMGLVILTPIAVLSWLPFVSELQMHLLFYEAFSRGLQQSDRSTQKRTLSSNLRRLLLPFTLFTSSGNRRLAISDYQTPSVVARSSVVTTRSHILNQPNAPICSPHQNSQTEKLKRRKSSSELRPATPQSFSVLNHS
ncbi:Glycosyl transferase [Trema orientale]|uniref:Glycosyl transferase n=1 Tax=Trema orientale TaxID=63057 RepID=A0A2P5DIH6_TREOI|nr:Glycosyl transferase [Trema orientale]